MNCPNCGVAGMTTSVQTIEYDGCALTNVLLKGVKVRDCSACGERLTTIPAIEGLFRTLAQIVIQKTGRLSAHEVRFLRKQLGWSGEDFAATFGVKPESVSRWEHGTRQINPQADRLLRLCVAQMEPASAYPLVHLRAVARADVPSRGYTYTLTRNENRDWQDAAVTA